MKSTKAILLVCAVLALCLLNAAALADGEAITGRADGAVEFYVYASANVTLTFSQTKGVLVTSTGMRQSAYGGYDIAWYPSYQPAAAQTVAFTGKSAAVQLSRGVYYTVRVTPQSMEALSARDAYLGLPGTYSKWQTPAAWSVNGGANARMSRAPLAGMATATPSPAPTAQVTIYNRLTSGTLISSRTETLSVGSHVLTGGLSSSYFTPVGSAYQTVTVYGNGTASQSSVTFYYQSRTVTATPKPTAAPTAAPVTATVYVYYRLTDGSLITYTAEKLSPGTHVITSKLNGSYFIPVGNTYETVTVYGNGAASRSSVTFYYQYSSSPATATPKPTAAPTAIPTAAPTPVTASVTVYYRLTDGTLISVDNETLTQGTHVIYSRLSSGYFVPVGNPYQTVTVYSNGLVSQSVVTFYYTYRTATAAPTAIPTAAPTAVPGPAAASILVQYRQTDGTLLYQETRVLTEGTHMISYDYRFDSAYWLRFAGPASYNVTVYGNGTASVGTIVFYFAAGGTATTAAPTYYAPYVTPVPLPTLSPTALPTLAPVVTPIPLENEALTDQLAVIGTDKIYPRPEPGKGKNTFNYEAIGQTVTVHSKARSLQNDGSWWVCISGTLRCWGQDYVIDHEWIKVTYLNQRSFDLNAVPLDPNY